MADNASYWHLSISDDEPTKDVSEEELWRLWACAERDAEEAAILRYEALEHERRVRNGEPHVQMDVILEQLRYQHIGGTVVQFPFEQRMITFASKPFLFRGEPKEFECSRASLNRYLDETEDPREKELVRAVANMRKWQFADLLRFIHIVPFWMAKLSDVNFDALAQHYGFPTHLLDLTNDFRAALFFATSKYVKKTDSYLPLSQKDIDASDDSKHGVVFYTPYHAVDYFATAPCLQWIAKHGMDSRYMRESIQSGSFDGLAFQIGCQPLQRCDRQSGYVFPMRNHPPLQKDKRFKRIRFNQSVELSRKVYEAMDGGKKVFPNEGITELRELIQQLRCTTLFDENDFRHAYEIDVVDRRLFPTLDSFRSDLDGYRSKEGLVSISDCDVDCRFPRNLIDKANELYDKIDIYDLVGGAVHMKPADREYFRERSITLFGQVL